MKNRWTREFLEFLVGNGGCSVVIARKSGRKRLDSELIVRKDPQLIYFYIVDDSLRPGSWQVLEVNLQFVK